MNLTQTLRLKGTARAAIYSIRRIIETIPAELGLDLATLATLKSQEPFMNAVIPISANEFMVRLIDLSPEVRKLPSREYAAMYDMGVLTFDAHQYPDFAVLHISHNVERPKWDAWLSQVIDTIKQELCEPEEPVIVPDKPAPETVVKYARICRAWLEGKKPHNTPKKYGYQSRGDIYRALRASGIKQGKIVDEERLKEVLASINATLKR